MIVELLFEPRDLWCGVYWDKRAKSPLLVRHIYLGIPFLVLHLEWSLGFDRGDPLPKPVPLFRRGSLLAPKK